MTVSFQSELSNKIRNQLISSRVLLDKLRLFDENSRKSSQYQDPNYLPFYFYLSKCVSANSILQIGLNLGLEICCFLQGNKNVSSFFGFQTQTEQFYSERLAFSNIKDINKKINLDYYYGRIYDEEFNKKANNFDLILISENSNFDKIKDCFLICWEKLNSNGFLVVDYLNYDKKNYKNFIDFCKSVNRKESVFKTRYGVGIVQR